MPDNWRSRIVGHGEAAPLELLPNPSNWRRHPKLQQDAIGAVMSEVGWVQDVIVNKTTGHLIDGHARVAVAIERNELTVPVVFVELDENEERIALASINPLAQMAYVDQEMVDVLVADAVIQNDTLRPMLEGLASPPPGEWAGPEHFTQSQIDAAGEKLASHFEQLTEARTQHLGVTCPSCQLAFSLATKDMEVDFYATDKAGRE